MSQPSEQTSTTSHLPAGAGKNRPIAGWLKNIVALCQAPDAPPKITKPLVAAFFLALVLLTVPTAPPDLGVDASWCGVLNWAHEKGLQFGSDIIFTYGPLGFLIAPYSFGQSTGVVVLVNALLCFQVACGLCLLAWRLGPIWRWLLILGFAWESGNVEPRADLALEAGFFCWGLLCLVASGRARLLAAANLVIFAAFAALTKVTYLFVAGFSVGAVVTFFAISGQGWLGVSVLSGFVLSFLLFWLGSAQSLGHLGEFLWAKFLVAGGYDQAAGMEGLPMLKTQGVILGATCLAVVLTRACCRRMEKTRHAYWQRAVTAIWVLGLLFVVSKHSLVRMDPAHLVGLMLFAPMVALGLEILPGCSGRFFWGARAVALLCCLESIVLLHSTFLTGWVASLEQPFRQLRHHARCLISPEKWSEEIKSEVEVLRKEAQFPQLQQLIGSASVDVFGSFQTRALLNGLNYRPRPVFQSYVAYSPRLAKLNEQFYLSEAAPEFVLFELSTMEHRFPPLNDGPALRVLLSNYEAMAAEGGFLLLKRKTGSETKLTLVREGVIDIGERIDFSQNEQNDLWLEAQVEPTWLGRLAQFLTWPSVLRLSAWREAPGAPTRIARFRAARPLLRTGFIASPFLMNSRDAQALYKGEQVARPIGYSIETDSDSARYWNSKVRFRLYRIEPWLGNAR